MRLFAKALLVFLLGVANFGLVASSERPNVLLIITDQHHAKMLSAAGNPYLKTRALDRMAESGIRFTNAYVTNPVCMPSRLSLATGIMPGRLGVFDNQMEATISDTVRFNSLGNLFKGASYDTFYGGKVHLPRELAPKDAGYDVVFPGQRDTLPGACIEFMVAEREDPFFAVASFINPHDICFAYNARTEGRKGMALVDELYRQAQSLPEGALPPLPENSGIPVNEPSAIEANLKVDAVTPAKIIRAEYTDRDWRNYRWIYCRLTERVDAQIGELMDGLREHGLEENTLVVFTADHGDMDGAHRLASKNLFYEESVGVPFMMQYPGVIPGGVVDDRSLVSNGLDVLPTLCGFAGIDPPDYLLGRNLQGVAEGKVDLDDRAYVVSENGLGRMLRTHRYKYCLYASGEPRESLVDIEKDPGEMHNLAGNPEYKAVLNRHRSYLLEWIAASKDIDAEAFANFGDSH